MRKQEEEEEAVRVPHWRSQYRELAVGYWKKGLQWPEGIQRAREREREREMERERERERERMYIIRTQLKPLPLVEHRAIFCAAFLNHVVFAL